MTDLLRRDRVTLLLKNIHLNKAALRTNGAAAPSEAGS
jgi:hypothetical protein